MSIIINIIFQVILGNILLSIAQENHFKDDPLGHQERIEVSIFKLLFNEVALYNYDNMNEVYVSHFILVD